jgi:aspartate/methionine/tyrosine aminotransferase
MPIAPFLIERYFGRYEFNVRHNLSASDCESMTVGELLELSGTPASELTDLHLGYTESQGHPALREALAGLYAVCGAGDVVVANAPEEAILVAMETMLEKGDRVVIQTPCYQSLRQIAIHKGCEVAPWEVVETESGWSADLDRLDSLLTGGTKLLVVNFPHNPTGLHVDGATWRKLLGMAAERGIRVFSDEMYRGVERGDDQRLPSACDVLDDAVTLWGTSKSFGLPGLRMGWLVTRDRPLLDAFMATKDYTSICSSATGELLTRSAASVAGKLFDRSRRIIRENLALTEEFMRRHEETFAWRRPDAGPVAFVRLREGSAAALADGARERGGVLLVPSPIFEHGDSHLRFGLGRKAFPEGLAVLERWLRDRI